MNIYKYIICRLSYIAHIYFYKYSVIYFIIYVFSRSVAAIYISSLLYEETLDKYSSW